MPPLINATGTIFHSAVKEPPLAGEAIRAANAAALSSQGGFDHPPGETPSLNKQPEELLCTLTGAEDILVVNNIQAAVFLVFRVLARGKHVLVPREDLTADKYSSAIITMLKHSGARLKRVSGKELAAQLSSGRSAGDDACCLLSINGWEGPAITGEGISSQHQWKSNIPAIKILHYAALLDLAPFGLNGGIQVQKLFNNGFDIIIFPGDKLLGGPAVGIIAGSERYISRIRKNPLCAALSADRISMAALEATAELFLDDKNVVQKIPLLRMITAPVERIEERARKLAGILKQELEGRFEVGLANENAQLARRNQEAELLPSRQVTLSSPEYSPRQIYNLLYSGNPPVISRLKKGKVLLDLRSVPEEEDKTLQDSLLASLSKNKEAENKVLDNVSSLIWVLNKDNRFTYVNKPCTEFWGLDAGSLLEKPLDEILKPGEADILLSAAAEVFKKGEQLRLEARLENAEGMPRWLDITLMPFFGGKRQVAAVTFTAADVTERKLNEEELKYYSMHDHLTGLYNRVYFEEEIRRLNAERHYPISVVVCDLDGLKLVNDTMGHGRGDELLKTAAEIIKRPFRSSDVVARVGGDEFAVILPSTDEKSVGDIAARIQKAVEEHNRQKNGIPLSLSVGFATGTDVSRGIMEIFKQADSNMYKNKFGRRDAVKKRIIDHLLSLLAEKDFQDEKYEERLQRMVLLLGQAIGLPIDELKEIMRLARLHDIGKVGIDDSILFKKEALNNKEWEEIKRHPEIGYRIACSSEEIAPLADYILQHHEHWDGSGYPKGLRGNEIHLYSRILAIADAYEAMTSSRPYRGPLSHEDAIKELKKNSGQQFDPRLVDIFISLIEEHSQNKI